MTDYLLAKIGTDRAPHYFESAKRLSGKDLITELRDLLAGHGRLGGNLINGQMVQEAQTDDFMLGRWRGGPMRLCGYIRRYDVFPVPVWPSQYAGLGDEELWRALNLEADERAAAAEERERVEGALRRLSIGSDDPDYAAARAALEGGASEDGLRKLAKLAVRDDVAPVLLAIGYRLPWQWAVATAETRDAYGTVERQLLAEIARIEAADA